MTVVETIMQRKSCRTYEDRAVDPGVLAEMSRFLAENTRTPFGSSLRFGLVDLSDAERRELRQLTTYGVIRGARHFIAGAVERHPMAMEDFGYCLEKAVLEAVSLGLGTCILGGTFRRSGFAVKMKLGQRELLPAVTPLGYPRGRKSLVDRVFRMAAGSDSRKPWGELFFTGNASTVLDNGEAGRFSRPLECVRLAPSASNKQPWRIIRDTEQEIFHFYLKRTPGYEKAVRDVSLQNIDMGIAMCHFELSALECGLPGDWTLSDPGIHASGMEYAATWQTR